MFAIVSVAFIPPLPDNSNLAPLHVIWFGGGWSFNYTASVGYVGPSTTEHVGVGAMGQLPLLLPTLFRLFIFVLLAMQMDKARGGGPTSRGGALVGPAFERLEQWLVGFPCRVLIRHVSYVGLQEGVVERAEGVSFRYAGVLSVCLVPSQIG